MTKFIIETMLFLHDNWLISEKAQEIWLVIREELHMVQGAQLSPSTLLHALTFLSDKIR